MMSAQVNKADEHDVEFLESGKDAAEPLKASKKTFNFIAPFIHSPVVFPRFDAVGFWRHDRNKSEIQRQLTSVEAFVGTVHDQVERFGGTIQCFEQCLPASRVMVVARRQGECHCRSSIRGNHMNFGGPSSARLSDGLWAVFFSAPVPSG